MRIFLFLLIVFLFQTGAEFPPVPEPEDILANPSQLVEKLPLIQANNPTRSLYYFDPEVNQWLTYPYPDDLPLFDMSYFSNLHIQRRSNGMYLINPVGYWGRAWRNETVWSFNPATGVFGHSLIACGEWVQSLPGEGEWLVIKDQEIYRLCFTETGEISPPIPIKEDGYTYCFSGPGVGYRAPDVSPEGDYVLFACYNQAWFTFYSYHILDHTFLNLGEGGHDFIKEVRWLNDYEAIIQTWVHNPYLNSYFIVDITKKENLSFIAREFYDMPFYFNNPPHIEWATCEYYLCGVGMEGEVYSYDFLTRSLHEFPYLEGIEGISLVIPDKSGDRLYRRVNYGKKDFRAEGISATLIRFNYETGEQREIFTGEVEWIKNFSPDGRYVVLEMGKNNEVATSWTLVDNQMGYQPRGKARIAILDLQTNTIIYKALGIEWGRWGFEPISLTWLDTNTFYIQAVSGRSDQIIRLNNRIEVVAEFEAYSTILSPNKRFLLVNEKEMSVYSIENNKTTPLIIPNKFKRTVEWNEDSTLLITLSYDEMVVGRWIVRP